MRQIGTRLLWIGHTGDLRDPSGWANPDINAVVELAAGEPAAVLPRHLIRHRIPLSDDNENRPTDLWLAAEAVANLIRAGYGTLVCCSAGMSRSICLTAAGIALAERRELRDALVEVAKSGPADVSPGLYASLLQEVSSPRVETRSVDSM